MTSNLTRRPTLLWFDLTHDRSTKELIAQFEGTCDCKLAKNSVLPIGEHADMICIHFDRPDTPGLRLLLEIKRSAPAIPITMFTVQHSEELAVWAMRSSVWEYIVLPLGHREESLPDCCSSALRAAPECYQPPQDTADRPCRTASG